MSQVAEVLSYLSLAVDSERDGDTWQAIVNGWAGIVAPPGSDLAAERSLEAEVAKLERRLTNLTTQYADGDVPREFYLAASKAAEGELAQKRSALAKLRRQTRSSQPPALDWAIDVAERGQVAIEREDIAAQRRVLADLVESIVPERIGFGKYKVHVTWTERGQYLLELSKLCDEFCKSLEARKDEVLAVLKAEDHEATNIWTGLASVEVTVGCKEESAVPRPEGHSE